MRLWTVLYIRESLASVHLWARSRHLRSMSIWVTELSARQSFFIHLTAWHWIISSCKAALVVCGSHTVLQYLLRVGLTRVLYNVGAALDVRVIDFKVSLQKAKLLISLFCSLFNAGVLCHVCYCNPEIFCVCFFCEDLAMEGIWGFYELSSWLFWWQNICQDGTPSASKPPTSPKLEGIIDILRSYFLQWGWGIW